MKTLKLRFSPWFAVCLAAGLAVIPQPGANAADRQDTSADKQRKLIAVLRSDAPPQEKAITCKRLAIYGNREAVPALAPLLANKDLASWARIALEAIPDPAADYALREAMTQLQGRLLIGVINSIGFRRDFNAVRPLADKLNDPDAEVACAAAEALGKIGGSLAAKALDQALDRAPDKVRSSVAYGSIVCAEQFLDEGRTADAVKAYDRVRQARVPKQRILEATRGAILARGAEGIPLLLEQLRSPDKARLAIGLRTARELPGREATEAVAAEMDRAGADRQNLLLQALADRHDAAVLPKLLRVAQSGPKQLRVIALGQMDRYLDMSAVPVLLASAAESDQELARPAKAALARFSGKEIEADLVARLSQASGKPRQVLIELARQRRIAAALPAVAKSIEDTDAGVRRAAIETVGILGAESEAAELARLLPKTQDAGEREDLEKSLVAICGRAGARCLPAVLPLAGNADAGVRKAALRALVSAGGADALAAVKTALNDREEAVQDEAVSTLANWPNTWPEDAGVAEPLLELAKSGKKPSHQIQGLQGYMQYVQEDKKLKNEEKLAKVNALLPVIKTTEAKRLAVSVLSTLPTAGALEPLMSFAGDAAVAEEACLGLVKIAADPKAAPAELRRKALQAAVEQSKNPATRKKAGEASRR